MNRVEDLLHQLRQIVSDDTHVAPHHKDMTHAKLDELDSWVTWLGIKARSGQIGIANPTAKLPTEFKITLDAFYELVDAYKDEAGCEVHVPGSPNRPMTVVVRAGVDDDDPHTYIGPTRGELSPEETKRFWEEADARGWTKSLRAQDIRKAENQQNAGWAPFQNDGDTAGKKKIALPEELIPGNIVMRYWTTGREFMELATEHPSWTIDRDTDSNYRLTPPGNTDRVYVAPISERPLLGQEFTEFVEKRLR